VNGPRFAAARFELPERFGRGESVAHCAKSAVYQKGKAPGIKKITPWALTGSSSSR